MLVHGIDDRIVPYSNSVKLNAALDGTSTPRKLTTVTGSGNNHMLGGAPGDTRSVKPIIYENQPWVDEAKKWLEAFWIDTEKRAPADTNLARCWTSPMKPAETPGSIARPFDKLYTASHDSAKN